jgi:hypothetical protein
MDASLYKYLIEELRGVPDKSYSFLPLLFVKAAVNVSDEAFESCKSFLKEIVLHHQHDPALELPHLLAVKDNFFASLFIRAHEAFIDILNGAPAPSHEFRHDGTMLLKFLVYCGNKGVPQSFYEHDVLECAMICFTIEALLHCGWCPDSFDGIAKRAAHEYFVCMKKELHHATTKGSATVLGYLWGAWLFAQKTEGIRDNGETTLPQTALFEWGPGGARRQYVVRKSLKPPLFYVLSKCSNIPPHPFHYLAQDALFGLTIFINNEVLFPKELKEYLEIIRPKIHGHKFVYSCKGGPSTEISWTMVFLNFESTMYRIDLLKFPEDMDRIALQAAMHIENEHTLEKIDDSAYFGKNHENFIVRFIENPLNLELSKQLAGGISVFSSKENHVLPNNSIKITTAWAQGKGIKDIHRTHLLGIYD